jgi:hypothetical protein
VASHKHEKRTENSKRRSTAHDYDRRISNRNGALMLAYVNYIEAMSKRISAKILWTLPNKYSIMLAANDRGLQVCPTAIQQWFSSYSAKVRAFRADFFRPRFQHSQRVIKGPFTGQLRVNPGSKLGQFRIISGPLLGRFFGRPPQTRIHNSF